MVSFLTRRIPKPVASAVALTVLGAIVGAAVTYAMTELLGSETKVVVRRAPPSPQESAGEARAAVFIADRGRVIVGPLSTAQRRKAARLRAILRKAEAAYARGDWEDARLKYAEILRAAGYRCPRGAEVTCVTTTLMRSG